MRIISRKAIVEFSRKYPDARNWLENWFAVVSTVSWRSLMDVRRIYPHADAVGRRTVFNVSGNKYRLITRINYQTQRVFILFILTHAEYDRGKWKR